MVKITVTRENNGCGWCQVVRVNGKPVHSERDVDLDGRIAAMQHALSIGNALDVLGIEHKRPAW